MIILSGNHLAVSLEMTAVVTRVGLVFRVGIVPREISISLKHYAALKVV